MEALIGFPFSMAITPVSDVTLLKIRSVPVAELLPITCRSSPKFKKLNFP
jgi:hypothetical protein